MSYILDALKKAEEERQRGTTPDVMTAQDVGPRKARGGRRTWFYLLLAALLLNAAVLVWWAGRMYTGRAVHPEQSAAGERVMNTGRLSGDVSGPGVAATSPVEGKPGSGLAENTPAAGKVRKMMPAQAVKSGGQESSGKKKEQNGLREADAETNEAPSGMAGEKESASATVPPDTNRIYAIDQLPPSIRQGLPDLTMSLHYYTDDPSLRIININGKTLKEGQEMTSGLKLEKITVAGAVFDYRHYRFSLEMQSK